MGMHMHVDGVTPPDDHWKKMKAVWDSCTQAGIGIPDDVMDFFDGEAPDPAGVLHDLTGEDCCAGYREEMVEGYEVDVSRLPPGVTKIRFTCRY